MLAVFVVRFVIWPQGRLCNGDATLLRYCSTVLRESCSGQPLRFGNVSETVARLTRLADYEAVPWAGTFCRGWHGSTTFLPASPAGHASGARRHHSNGSSSAGMVPKALFKADVSFPPASAKSGLPPPEPPTNFASACISLPAWTLAVRSLVTPAIRATLPSSAVLRTTTPDPIFCLRESTNCLRVSLSVPVTSAAITLIPLMF